MTASNLSICVGPSLIWAQDQSLMMDHNYSKEVSGLVQILIEQYAGLWPGPEAPELFQEAAEVSAEVSAEVGERARSAEAAAGQPPAERTSSLSSTKSESTAQQRQGKKGDEDDDEDDEDDEDDDDDEAVECMDLTETLSFTTTEPMLGWDLCVLIVL